MKITKEEIEAAQTTRGGWSKETLASWGVPWPPTNSWKKKLIEYGFYFEGRMPSKKKNWVAHPTNVVAIDFEAARKSRERQEMSVDREKPRSVRATKRAVKKGKRIPEFFNSKAWLEVRYQVLKRDGARCACCGVTPAQGATMNVDHIKPRWKYPELALDLNNLQVLCARCNEGKGGKDKTDWRKKGATA